MRRHGWQRPLHPLQVLGIAVYCFLVLIFYVFLGLFLGSRVAEITVTAVFSFVVLSVMLLFVRCTATDPTDRTSFRKKKKMKKKEKRSRSNAFFKLNYGFILGQIALRFLWRIERKILRTFIRRQYLDPRKIGPQMEPLLPFPLIVKDDAVVPDQNEVDITFCTFCDFEVQKHSKHCRTCNRCVEGFDHHCRWLNNCIGKKNYTSFFLLMIFALLMLTMEGGTAFAVFVRCFSDKRGIESELRTKLHVKFPREALATISVLVVLITGYGSAALAQLFFFHVVLIRKGMRTYDYILAMKEENRSIELDMFEDDYSSDLSSSDESSDYEHPPQKRPFVSQFICRGGRGLDKSPGKLSIRVDGKLSPTSTSSKKEGLRVSIDPWKLIKLSRDKALAATQRARERLVKQPKPGMEGDCDSLKPLPLETKSGPVVDADRNNANSPLISVSPAGFSSPRRRFSGTHSLYSHFSGMAAGSPKQKYRSNFDLKLTEVSRELETYISRQVLSSVLKNEGTEASPR